jgi:zinc protease
VTLDDPAEKGFTTDQPDIGELAEPDEQSGDGLTPDVLTVEPSSATVIAPTIDDGVRHEPDLSVLDVRPGPGRPREYHFPRFERFILSNGLTVVHAHVAGRALVAAQLLLPGGGWTEPADQAGVTVLTGRAMTEGTRRRDANDFIEAAERLGAEIHADATWETVSASVEVPRSRFGDALGLLAEMVAEPAFPASEVERLRDERMNDLLQAWSDPRRRAERVFPETIYDAGVPYRRPLAGVQATVRTLDRDAVVARHASMVDAASATLVVAGDLGDVSVRELAERHVGGLPAGVGARAQVNGEALRPGQRAVILVDRPGAPQSEIRIGHVGVPRRTPDFHALSVLNAILGGTFNSRLNRVIREELGYTYGINSSFDMRLRAGPFVIRTAVESAVTGPAILETLRIVADFLESDVEADELGVARDYLVGVFPLRFEGAAQVASALGGLIVFDLPDDELDRYRPRIAEVSAAAIRTAATRYIKPSELSIVVIGDARQVEAPLREAQLGDLIVVPADTSPE